MYAKCSYSIDPESIQRPIRPYDNVHRTPSVANGTAASRFLSQPRHCGNITRKRKRLFSVYLYAPRTLRYPGRKLWLVCIIYYVCVSLCGLATEFHAVGNRQTEDRVASIAADRIRYTSMEKADLIVTNLRKMFARVATRLLRI